MTQKMSFVKEPRRPVCELFLSALEAYMESFGFALEDEQFHAPQAGRTTPYGRALPV
jgi:hypothetical protein